MGTNKGAIKALDLDTRSSGLSMERYGFYSPVIVSFAGPFFDSPGPFFFYLKFFNFTLSKQLKLELYIQLN